MNKFIDHTLLKQNATRKDIENLCNEAIRNNFKSVCVNPCWVKLAKELLISSDILVCTVIGFPLGANTIEIKVYETKNAILNGADEIDMVINIGQLKDNNFDYVYEEIKEVVNAASNRVVKVIIETCLLTDNEKVKACELAIKAKANFVKTSTGFSTGGAVASDVKLMKMTIGTNGEVKASGGIKRIETFEEMINAGATIVGTSSGCQLLNHD